MKMVGKSQGFFPLGQESQFLAGCQVSDWLASGASAEHPSKKTRGEGDSINVSLGVNPSPSVLYLFQSAVRATHPTLWTTVATLEGGTAAVTVTVVTPESRLALQAASDLENDLVEASLGFTRVYRALVASGKPIVGKGSLYQYRFETITFRVDITCINQVTTVSPI